MVRGKCGRIDWCCIPLPLFVHPGRQQGFGSDALNIWMPAPICRKARYLPDNSPETGMAFARYFCYKRSVQFGSGIPPALR